MSMRMLRRKALTEPPQCGKGLARPRTSNVQTLLLCSLWFPYPLSGLQFRFIPTLPNVANMSFVPRRTGIGLASQLYEQENAARLVRG